MRASLPQATLGAELATTEALAAELESPALAARAAAGRAGLDAAVERGAAAEAALLAAGAYFGATGSEREAAGRAVSALDCLGAFQQPLAAAVRAAAAAGPAPPPRGYS